MKSAIIAIILLIGYSGVPIAADARGGRTMLASWYDEKSLVTEGTWKHSKGVMANGQRFNSSNYTCASRDWRLGTVLSVTNLRSGVRVLVRVSDRTAKRFKGKRIDLSRAAFEKIAPLEQGLVKVDVEVVTSESAH